MVAAKKDGLWFTATRNPSLTGKLYAYQANTFVVKCTDRSLDAVAYVLISLDKNGKAVGFTIEAISPLTDFSFDFHDLDLKRVE